MAYPLFVFHSSYKNKIDRLQVLYNKFDLVSVELGWHKNQYHVVTAEPKSMFTSEFIVYSRAKRTEWPQSSIQYSIDSGDLLGPDTL